jgi:hypothetical protein
MFDRKNRFRLGCVLAALAGSLLACATFPFSTRPSPTAAAAGEISLDQALTVVARAGLAKQGTPSAAAQTAASDQPEKNTSAPQLTLAQSYAVTAAALNAAFPSSTPLPADLAPLLNITIRPTFTARPTQTPANTDIPQPSFTPTPTLSPGLPGLTMADVTNRLQTEKKFQCQSAGEDSFKTLWMCDYQEGITRWYHVDLYSTSSASVYYLQAAVFQSEPDDTAAAAILAYLAALPYTGSNPASASSWVSQNLPALSGSQDLRQTTIGIVPFKLYGSPNGRYLEMGTQP